MCDLKNYITLRNAIKDGMNNGAFIDLDKNNIPVVYEWRMLGDAIEYREKRKWKFLPEGVYDRIFKLGVHGSKVHWYIENNIFIGCKNEKNSKTMRVSKDTK